MENSSSGMGFFEVLTLIFIVLKLVHVIDWPWIWVLSPIWIGILFIVLVAIILKLIELIGDRPSIEEIINWFRYKK